MARHLSQELLGFLAPLVVLLDAYLDHRLVDTFVQTIAAIITFRHRANGLLLSELGAYLESPAHAPAGTKRLGNLLRSPKWASALLGRFLWQRAEQRVAEFTQAEEEGLLLWDESVIEKSESITLEGLCAVRSSKAARLKRIKPGYYNPPGGRPVFVPGMHWLAVLLVGRQGPPVLAAMRWWTTRGPFAHSRREEEESLLKQCALAWGGRVLHTFDRGFAGGPWLGLCLGHVLRFIMRWPKHYLLRDATGNKRKAWQITRGKRSWAQRQVWDARRHQWYQAGVLAVPVRHPDYQQPLWLVVSRPGKGRLPWYLLTADPIETEEDAWRVVFAYARRWQIEMTWRYCKSELAFESPRLRLWDQRLKLLLMASLAYAFLLTFLLTDQANLRAWLLRQWCHRTGKRYREVTAPLYRLRWALSRLWQAYPPFASPPSLAPASTDPPPTNWQEKLCLFLLLLNLVLLVVFLNFRS
jgi:hypothetical protein